MVRISTLLLWLALGACAPTPAPGDITGAHSSASWQHQVASEVRARSLVDDNFALEIADAIRAMVEHTRYGSDLVLNAPPINGGLSIIFLRVDASDLYSGTCAYIGAGVIICDTGFLRTFLDRAVSLDPQRRSASERVFWSWVIGHEIAHADLDHPASKFVLGSSPLTQEGAIQMHKRELEADARFLQLAPNIDRVVLEHVLIATFDAEYRNKYGEADYPGSALVADTARDLTFPYALGRSHPSMMIRTGIFLYKIGSTQALRDEARSFLDRSYVHILDDRPIREPQANQSD